MMPKEFPLLEERGERMPYSIEAGRMWSLGLSPYFWVLEHASVDLMHSMWQSCPFDNREEVPDQ